MAGKSKTRNADDGDILLEHWPLERFIPYARNTRTHSDEQVPQIAASIKEFGFVNPILAGPDRVIVAGHARLLASRKLGLAEAPVIVLEGLSENQRRALAIADNRLHQMRPDSSTCRTNLTTRPLSPLSTRITSVNSHSETYRYLYLTTLCLRRVIKPTLRYCFCSIA